ncbi:MAG: allantoate amidohydrolase [Beijerinckiaceae bacterium]|nr:allantoate amidohydrolase [Beijerinckiaceae bacterium]
MTTGAARVIARLKKLNEASDDEGALTRLTLSPAHARAAAMVRRWMELAGLAVRLDAVGNVVGRREGATPAAKTLIIGSHIDTVRNAGSFDGNLGVLLGVEACAHLGDKPLPYAIEVVAFGDEEGVRFPTSLTGSRALAGTFDPVSLSSVDEKGVSRRDALLAFGCDPSRAQDEARDPSRMLGYIEVHIEQGPVLEANNLALGLVTAINGGSRGEIFIEGAAGHAGTLPMNMRKDALAAAAEIVLAVEQIGKKGVELVATVGRIDVPNGAVNVVPGRTRMSFDVRSPRDDDRIGALADLRAEIARIATARGVKAGLNITYDMPAAICDKALSTALARSFERCDHPVFRLPSGAGHDAMSFRERIPQAMVFVRCRGGVSHRPEEFASPADIASALAVLEDFLETIGAPQ